MPDFGKYVSRLPPDTDPRLARALADVFRDIASDQLPLDSKLEKIKFVSDYGAMGDGSDESAKINQAITDLNSDGGGYLFFERGKSYFLGSYSSDGAGPFQFSDLSNITFVGQGSELLVTTTANSQPNIFSLTNPVNISFVDLRFRDSGIDLSVEWKGARAINITGSGSSGFAGGIKVDHCVGDGLVGFVVVVGDANKRIRNIGINDCLVKNTYYATNFQENGDSVRIRNLRCENVRRSYFPYGVSDHDVDVSIYHDGTSYGANSACLIKRYVRDTRNIRLRATFLGSVAQYTHGVTLEHQPTSGTSVIEDVRVEVHLANVSSANSMIPFHFRSFTALGVEETSTTSNIWRRISFGGSLVGYTGTSAISFGVKPTTEADIALDPTIGYLTDITEWKSGYCFKLSHDREARLVLGDLTAATVTIPLAAFDSRAFTIKVRVWAHDNYTSLATQNATFEERVITGYNAGGGAVTIQNNQSIIAHSQGTAATVTYTANGENIDVTFAGAAYANANANARVDVEYVSLLPGR